MSRGQLVPDDTIVRVFLDRLHAPDALGGAILDGFPRTEVQAQGAGRRAPGRGPPRRPRALHRRPARGPGPAHGEPAHLRGQRARLQPGLEPAEGRGHLRPRRVPPPPARGRRGGDRSRPDGPAGPAAPRRRRALPPPRRPRRRSTARSASPARPRASSRPSTSRPRAPDRGHPQVPGRDRPHAPRRPRRRRGPRAHRGGDPAGRLDRRPGPHRRGPYRPRRRDPVLQGLPGHPRRPFPASRLHLASTTRWSTGSPATRTLREGQIVSVDAGAIVDGWHGDAARTFFVGDAAGGRGRS